MKNNGFGTVFGVFVFGVFAGIFCARATLENKYREQAEKEIESVKKAFSNRREIVKVPNPAPSKPDIFDDTLRHYQGETEKNSSGPVIISPEEYGEKDRYLLCELTSYADGVVTDEMNDPVDISDTIGEDYALHFGEFEDDAVYVRNPSRMCDYAVYRDLRRYSDVVKTMPPDIRNLNDFPDDEEDDETG